MRDWNVIGADRDTGEDRALAVNALTEEEAREEAAAKGIVVESVREAPAVEPVGRTSTVPPCPLCGARVFPVQRVGGSMFLFVLLLLCGLLPGLIYAIFCLGKKYVCPRCGAVRSSAM